MKVYFLSGLGADSRSFKYLRLPKGYEPIYIDWLDPLAKESLTGYSERISKKIDTSEPFILIGLSFGGILSTEVVQFVKPLKTILISSVARRKELPAHYKLASIFQ